MANPEHLAILRKGVETTPTSPAILVRPKGCGGTSREFAEHLRNRGKLLDRAPFYPFQ